MQRSFCCIAVFLLSFTSIVQTQEIIQIQNSLFAQPDDGGPVLEMWQQPKWDEKIGRPGLMAINSSNEIIIWSENWHMVSVGQGGNILSVKLNLPSSITAIKDDMVYGLFSFYQGDKYIYQIMKFCSRGRHQQTINLSGYSGNLNGRLMIASNGDFIFANPVYEDAYYSTTHVVHFGSDGKFIKSWDIQEAAPEIITEVRSFVITRNDLLACLYNRDKKIYLFDLEGKDVRNFEVSEASNGYLPYNIYLNHNNQIVAYEAFTRSLQVFKLNGNLVSNFELTNSPNPQISGHKLCFDSSGNIYLHEFEPETISKFAPDGDFQQVVVSTAKLTTPSAIYDGRGPYSNKLITQAPDGTIYGLHSDYKSVNILSARGKPLGSFSVPEQKYYPIQMQVTPDGNIAILYYNRLVFFSPEGKILDTWKDFADPVGFDVAPNGMIYMATQTYRDSQLVCFKKTGKKKYSKMKYGENEEHFKHPGSIALGPDGNLHVLDTLKTIKVYKRTGAFVKSIPLGQNYEKVGFDHNGNYLLLGFDHFSIADLDGNLMEEHKHLYFSDLDDVLRDNAGAFIATDRSAHRMIRFNSSKVLTPRGNKVNIKGKLKYTKEIKPSYSPGIPVYLEGTDKKGRKFFAFSTINKDSGYSFSKIPLKTSYKIWSDDPNLLVSTLKKTFFTGTVAKAFIKNFITKSVPQGFVRVYGIVKTAAGLPINGVIVSNGNHKAITGLDGRYKLLLPANTTQSVTATKNGYSFRNNGRTVELGENDKLFLSFKAK
jgi:hypothetical protein